MNRFALVAGLAAALAAGPSFAASNSTQPSGYLTEAGAPIIAPYQTLHSDTTLQKQRDSGYFSYAGAPQVAPYGNDAGAGTTLLKQRQSGYFPTAGAPQVAPTTSGAQ